jgi:hypothetical protein
MEAFAAGGPGARPDLRPVRPPPQAVQLAPGEAPAAHPGPNPGAVLAPAAKPPARRSPRPPQPQFILVNGGTEDRDLVSAVAKRLEALELDVAVPLSVLASHSGIRSSTLTRDLRDKLSLCDSVLMVYRQGPVDQVSHHLIECLKACAKVPKGRRPPVIGLCQTQADPLALGLRTRGMRVHVVGGDCADECVEWFLEESTA